MGNIHKQKSRDQPNGQETHAIFGFCKINSPMDLFFILIYTYVEFNIKHLDNNEYFPSRTTKDTIYLHHTAGSHRPDWTIDAWNRDRSATGNKVKIATSYVIGGISTRTDNKEFDGKIYEAFDPVYWAHHLGVKSKNNTFLNQKSIGIELCNYGPLTKTSDGRFFTYVKTEIPKKYVTKLDEPFRGHLYYHSYTKEQLKSLEFLLIDLSDRFEIDVTKGLKREIERSELVMPSGLTVREKQVWLNKNGFTDRRGKKLSEDNVYGPKTIEAESKIGFNPLEFNQNAVDGYPGIWSHTNVRIDKSDIFPQPELLDLLKNI